jgi:hypothetical protein
MNERIEVNIMTVDSEINLLEDEKKPLKRKLDLLQLTLDAKYSIKGDL